MKRISMPLAFLMVVSMGMAAQAGPFGLFNRQPVRNTAHVAQHATQGAVYGVAGGIAQAKAEQQARSGVMRHVGGSMGAGRYEGVGFSTESADHAIRKCCYWGQRTPVDIGVARGRTGWYATVLYR